MCLSRQGRFRQQVAFVRRQFLQEGQLPFTDILSTDCFSQALETIGVCWNDRIFTPLVTLWVFLGQVLSADQSCVAAVARLIAHRVSQGLRPCSSETGAYCQARKRLPERFFSIVAFLVGRKLDASVDSQWLWKGRRVYLFDGSTVSMPDTAENRKEYPLTYNQKPGTGSPSRGLAPSFRCRVERSLSWGSAVTPAKAKASWGCCASCGACFAAATSWWRIA
jgi:hypothetical protein